MPLNFLFILNLILFSSLEMQILLLCVSGEQ